MAGALYRSGALVFGGGHVVLPLLDAGVVDPGWVGEDRFLAGYGAAQAVPGPLFSFAAYLGAVATPLGGVAGGAVALVAIYLPSFLLLFGVLPFWDLLRRSPGFRRALIGVNAAVVGLLAAALYQPVWTGAVASVADVAIVAVALAALVVARLPPIAIVVGCAIAGSAARRAERQIAAASSTRLATTTAAPASGGPRHRRPTRPRRRSRSSPPRPPRPCPRSSRRRTSTGRLDADLLRRVEQQIRLGLGVLDVARVDDRRLLVQPERHRRTSRPGPCGSTSRSPTGCRPPRSQPRSSATPGSGRGSRLSRS